MVKELVGQGVSSDNTEAKKAKNRRYEVQVRF